MKAVIETWWRQLSARERRLVSAMLVLLAVILSWLAVVRPLNSALARAEARHASALTALADLRAARADIERLAARPMPPADETLVTFVGRLATEAGMPLERLEGEGGDQVTLTVKAARPPALLGWVQGLEVRHGLIVERLALTRNDDATVSAQATLRRPVR